MQKALLIKIALGLTAIIAIVMIVGYFKRDKIVDYPSPTVGTNIIIFGDSLAMGQGSTDGHDLASIIQKDLNTPTINAGVSGDTVPRAYARVSKDVVGQDPKVVIILLGGNDFFQRVPPKETIDNLGSIIDTILPTGAGIILINENRGLGTTSDFKKLAKQKNIPYIENIMGGIMGNRNLMSDEIHPNDAGYEIMAKKIEPVLINYLK
jgi:acyl-CoA thioesterase-1